MLLPLPPPFPLETEAEDEEAADGEDEKADSKPRIVRRPGAVEVEDVELERTPSCCCVWRFRPRHRRPTPFCPRCTLPLPSEWAELGVRPAEEEPVSRLEASSPWLSPPLLLAPLVSSESL